MRDDIEENRPMAEERILYDDCFTKGLFKLVSENKMVQNKPFMRANQKSLDLLCGPYAAFLETVL
jgi:hypothetical protein